MFVSKGFNKADSFKVYYSITMPASAPRPGVDARDVTRLHATAPTTSPASAANCGAYPNQYWASADSSCG
jgi:hypothetical protein